ncbi:MAG: acyl-CoA synthetase FdrA [Eubacteriales bacterium]|nr:acyl-CoA synthetase FdrA [Eubacteriales bacterium]
MVKLDIKKGAYYDSVSLMIISKDVKKVPGVKEALVGMGTDLNKEISHNIGLNSNELDTVTANDFFVVASVENEEIWQNVLLKVEELLNKKKEATSANYYPPTLSSALKIKKDLNMAIISVPGKYAKDVANDCLDNNINVMLFSDNVSIEDEKKLKEKAVSKGLLMMGPDCGTAIINNTPLAFANVITPGDIGIVGASGTGTQEVSSLIDRYGGGVSQVIGTGGRDLKEEIGGIMFSFALQSLIDDKNTKVILLTSKPPAADIQTKILKQAKDGGKPTVVSFVGADMTEIEKMGLIPSISLEDAAKKAVAISKGKTPTTFDGFDLSDDEIEKIVLDATKGMKNTQKYLRALYTGGTICDEAMKMLIKDLGHIYSNIPLNKEDKLADKNISKEHTALDFGDDEFTVGRAHPMIDPSLRAERIIKESLDETTKVILCDCVIGYGSNPDPSEDLCDAIIKAKKNAKDNGRVLPIVCEVLGTNKDPQSFDETCEKIKNAGAIIMPTNAQAVRLTKKIINKEI